MKSGAPPDDVRAHRRLLATAWAIAVVIFVLDFVTPSGVPTSALYVLVVLLGLWEADPRFPVRAAVAGTGLTGLGLVLAAPAADVGIAAATRVLSLFIVWLTAVLVVRYKRTEHALREKTKLEQEYLDVAGVIIVALDTDQNVTLINRKGCLLLGYRQKEIIGQNWFDNFLPPEIAAGMREVFEQVKNGRNDLVEYHENPILTRTREQRLIAWHNAPLRGEDGRIIGTLSSGEDITDRKRAEQRLRESTKELEEIKYALDQSAIVAITDPQGTITYVNDKFCEISKYSRAELIGQDHRIVNSGHHPKAYMRGLWTTIADGQIWHGEIRNRAKDGTLYWVDTTIVPFLEAHGKPYQYLAIRYDITERKRAEGLLHEQAALARLGQMAAIIAHEVKNPLAGIRGALQVVRGPMSADSRDHTVIGDVIARLDSLNELVQDLLLFARPRAPKIAPVSLKSLVERTTMLLKKDPGLAAVEVALSGDDPVAHADAGQLQHVFQNVLLNAGQAMGGEGRVHVTAKKTTNGRCEIVFADSGPGMPLDVRARVFEPFFTTKHRGTGLGLSIAKQIIDLHHGDLWVDTPAGGGTTVHISLPGE